MAASLNNSAWLQWIERLMGGVSQPRYAATFPPNRFHCLLDDLPLQLVPRPALDGLDHTSNEGPWCFNPACTLLTAAELPDLLSGHEDLLSKFALQGTIAWVRNDAGSVWPFWLGPRLEQQLQELKSSGQPILNLTSDMRLSLRAGILTSARDRTHGRSEWQKQIEMAGALFRKKGYAPLHGLIHPFHIASLRRYYRYLIRSGQIRLGDGQSPLRYVAYNEPVARFFHRQLTGALSAVAGERLKPSYVYLASYLGGAELKKHTDREQCEFSITLCLDFSPEPVLETSWPIRLDTPSGQVTVYQALGDGLAYRGTRLPHYRDPLPLHQTSTSIFFHYVPESFTGSLE